MKLKVKVTPNHRYEEIPLRQKDGGKLYIHKQRLQTVDTDDLADGEEFTIRRYEVEGRLIVKAV